MRLRVSKPGQVENISQFLSTYVFFIFFNLLLILFNNYNNFQFTSAATSSKEKTLNQTQGYLPIVGEKVNGLFKARDEIRKGRQERMLY